MTDDFDIGALDAQDEATLVIVHPKTREPTTWVWTFYGPGHPVTLALAERLSKRFLNEEREKEAAQVNGKKWKPDAETPDELRAFNVKNMVTRLKDFSDVSINGETIKFSPEQATRLLLDPRKGWLYAQVSEFLKAETSFMRPSGKA